MLYSERHNIAKMIEPYAKGNHGKEYIEHLKEEDRKRGWDEHGNKLVKPGQQNNSGWMRMPW